MTARVSKSKRSPRTWSGLQDLSAVTAVGCKVFSIRTTKSLRLSLRVPDRAKQMAARRLPPQHFAFPIHDFTLVDALIEGLADLRYTHAVRSEIAQASWATITTPLSLVQYDNSSRNARRPEVLLQSPGRTDSNRLSA